MIVKITEGQYNNLIEPQKIIREGVDWSLNDDGSFNLSVNHNRDEKSNKSGKANVDTRIFGTKDEILNGKPLTKTGEINNRAKSLSELYKDRQTSIQQYQNVIDYIENGRKGEIEEVDGVDKQTRAAIISWFIAKRSDAYIIDACKKAINRLGRDSFITHTYNRVNKGSDKGNMLRYLTSLVPETNVRCISLFSMGDFNFSDAIKHGTVRQNGTTDKMLGITSDEREKDTSGKAKTIDVTYDGQFKPDVRQNFSLTGVNRDHQKQQYGLGRESGYTSVNAFLDKSVMYADRALKDFGFRPDVIVSAPSSSKFNEYYCTNLSNKMGIPYISDFFQRNMINVRFNEDTDITAMRNDGFSEKDILSFAGQVKSIAYKEIAYFVTEPVRDYVMLNRQTFETIPTEKSSRQKMPLEYIIECISRHAYEMSVNFIQSGDDVTKHLIENFYKEMSKSNTKRYNYEYLLSQIKVRVNKKPLKNVIYKVYDITRKYANILKTNGYRLQFNSKRFKITQIKKPFRPYLRNVYIVADKYISQNGQLFTRLKNSKFLIFDEDINSGATLKLIIEALQEKLPSCPDSNLLCLTNAYSASGF